MVVKIVFLSSSIFEPDLPSGVPISISGLTVKTYFEGMIQIAVIIWVGKKI